MATKKKPAKAAVPGPAMDPNFKKHHVALDTADGAAVVKEFTIPPFAVFPDVVMHKGKAYRFWARDEFRSAPDDVPILVYREALVYEAK